MVILTVLLFVSGPNIKKTLILATSFEFYKQIFTRQESSVMLGLCGRNTLHVEHDIFAWWGYVTVCIWGAAGLFIVQTALSIAAFTDEEHAAPQQKLNTHMHSFAALALGGFYIALINLNQTVLPTLTSSRTWNWTFRFFDFPALKFGHIILLAQSSRDDWSKICMLELQSVYEKALLSLS